MSAEIIDFPSHLDRRAGDESAPYEDEEARKRAMGLEIMAAVDRMLAVKREGAPQKATAMFGKNKPAKSPQPESPFSKNERLRAERYRVWRAASAKTSYWDARLDFESAISIAQNHGIPEALAHPQAHPEDRLVLIEYYRQAKAEQLLTPAPTVAAVNWK
jgi:hypothetical protein